MRTVTFRHQNRQTLPALSAIMLTFTLLIQDVGAYSQEAKTALRALFPPSNAVSGWTLKQEPKFFGSLQVFDYMDGAGEIPRSYDLRQLASARYSKGSVTLELVIFDLGKSENAFGYYSARSYLERSPTAHEQIIALDHPARLYTSVGILTLWKGHYTAIVQPDVGKPDAGSLAQFGRAVTARIKEKGALPDLLRLLPTKGKTAHSERYLRGKASFDTLLLFTPKDVFGASAGTDAVAAEYTMASGLATLCVIRYSTPGAAKTAHTSLKEYLLARKSTGIPTHLPGAIAASIPRFKSVGALPLGRYLAVVVSDREPTALEPGLQCLQRALSNP
jgi:hypothetical protein